MVLSMYASNCVFRCYLTYDDNLSGLSTSTYSMFGELCVWAAKRYIHKELRIKLDRGYIEGGFEIGEVKNIVDEYSDAEQNYKDLLEDGWPQNAAFGDRQQATRATRMMIGFSTS